MDPVDQEMSVVRDETIEPLDDWLLLQPSMDEDRKGRILLPASVEGSRLARCFVLAAGDRVSDLVPGDLVLALATHAIDLRDGSKLMRREHVVARLR